MNTAVLFDLDETLFDRTGSLRRFLRHQFGEVYPATFADTDAAIDRFLELDTRGMVPKDRVYETLVAEQGIAAGPHAAEMFDHYTRNVWRFAQGFAGMKAVLCEIRASGCKLGLVTNGQKDVQMRSIEALALDRLVDTVLISEVEGLRKPDPAIFKLAARRLEVASEDCVFVGDAPVADIAGAGQVGMKTVWFPNGAIWPDDLALRPDAEIGSLGELTAILNRFRSEI